MDIKPIKTDADYRATLAEIERLMTAEVSTPVGECRGIMVTRVDAYERWYFPLELPDPVDAIRFQMYQMGLTVKDLEPMVGRSNRVNEVLNRKRPLTLKMIWRLHRGLGMPAESLIRPPSEATLV